MVKSPCHASRADRRHHIEFPEYMVRELYRCQPACRDQIVIGYRWFVHIILFAPVVRAEHLQGGRVIARMRTVVQQAGIGQDRALPRRSLQ